MASEAGRFGNAFDGAASPETVRKMERGIRSDVDGQRGLGFVRSIFIGFRIAIVAGLWTWAFHLCVQIVYPSSDGQTCPLRWAGILPWLEDACPLRWADILPLFEKLYRRNVMFLLSAYFPCDTPPCPTSVPGVWVTWFVRDYIPGFAAAMFWLVLATLGLIAVVALIYGIVVLCVMCSRGQHIAYPSHPKVK